MDGLPKRVSKKRGGAEPVKVAALGVGLSMAGILLRAAVGGLLISNGTVPEEADGVIAAAAMFLVSFLGPLPLLHSTGKRALPTAYFHMGLILALLAIVKLILWPDAVYGSWSVLAASLAGATLSGLLQAQRTKRRR